MACTKALRTINKSNTMFDKKVNLHIINHISVPDILRHEKTFQKHDEINSHIPPPIPRPNPRGLEGFFLSEGGRASDTSSFTPLTSLLFISSNA